MSIEIVLCKRDANGNKLPDAPKTVIRGDMIPSYRADQVRRHTLRGTAAQRAKQEQQLFGS